MRPRKLEKSGSDDLFRSRLDQIINMKRPLVAQADRIDWAWLDEQLADCFSDQGRPAEPVRFMIGMFLLKHTYGLSDEQLWDQSAPPQQAPAKDARRHAARDRSPAPRS